MGNTSGKVKEQGWPCPALGLPPGRCWVPAAARPSVHTAPHTGRGRLSAELRCLAASLFWCGSVVLLMATRNFTLSHSNKHPGNSTSEHCKNTVAT